METKVALLVIYNHRYDKNIPRIQTLYASRFSHIFHIVPFYDGNLEGVNVIPVYESSYYFQGYISQAYTHLRGQGFTHYLIIADDLILNPKVDEGNIWETMGVREDECFIPAGLIFFQKLSFYWPHLWDALTYRVKVRGVEIEQTLPDRDFACQRFQAYGIPTGPVPIRVLAGHFMNYVKAIRRIPWSRRLDYPLVGCYSDTLFVTEEAMGPFCTYCGAFAATKLFVELAIPTALILASDRVKFNKDLRLHYGALWPDTIHELDPYHYDLQKLLDSFPEDKFFIHPVKLSKWK